MRVSKVTIGRLFNLGSYEQVRYEVTVDIGEDESATCAVVAIERLLSAMNPKPPGDVPSEDDSKRELSRLVEMGSLSDEDFERRHGGYKGTRDGYLARIRLSIAEGIERRKVWQRKADKARDLLEDLGAARVWKDAKLDWEDQDYQ